MVTAVSSAVTPAERGSLFENSELDTKDSRYLAIRRCVLPIELENCPTTRVDSNLRRPIVYTSAML